MNSCLPSDLYIVTTNVFLFVQGPDMNNLCCIHATSKRGRDCLRVTIQCIASLGSGWCHPPGVPFPHHPFFPSLTTSSPHALTTLPHLVAFLSHTRPPAVLYFPNPHFACFALGNLDSGPPLLHHLQLQWHLFDLPAL